MTNIVDHQSNTTMTDIVDHQSNIAMADIPHTYLRVTEDTAAGDRSEVVNCL